MAKLECDVSDTDGGGGSAYFDRAILVPGRIPKDVY